VAADTREPAEETATRPSTRERLRRYLRHTRGGFTGFLMGAPLALGYVLCVLFGPPLDAHERDFFINLQMELLGPRPYMFVQIGLAVGLLGLVLVLERRRRFDPRLFAPLVVEAMFHATVLSCAVWFGLRALHLQPAYAPASGALEPIVSALGEAVNEETVFRWLLLEALLIVLLRVCRFRRGTGLVLAVLVAALIYAAAGTAIMRDQGFVTLGLSGAFYSLLYCLRGYPACAYTHAFYATYWHGVLPHL
jgi:hypothetical protein